MRDPLSLRPAAVLAEDAPWQALTASGARALWIVLPILGATFFAALAAPIAIGGWNFSPEALVPQLSRLNPANGLGRMFSARGVVELGKGLAKVGVIGVIGWVVLKGLTPELMGLSAEPVNNAIGHAASLAGYALLVLTCGLAIIAMVDVPFQLWQHAKELRMT